MAKVRYFKVEVTLNNMAKHVADVPEWEVGILQAQWGDDARVIEDETSPYDVKRKLPQPRDEFERLAMRYGPKHEETPYVAGVFGNFGPGVNALRDAIARSTQPLPEPIEDEDELDVGGDVPVIDDEDEGGDSFADLAGLTGDASTSAETDA